ncbi:MAG: rhodanese-like domain-containing protein [Syntrophales bacterium LBB04]|nr:rhodanese-like domain-containing protein [Syntrophales bacterium LBB04]
MRIIHRAYIILSLWIALFFVIPVWAGGPSWKVIKPQTLHQMLERDGGFVLINTMSYLECLDHSIPGSLCIASEEFENKISQLPGEKDKALVFYCESEASKKSCEAADAAVRYGYTNVFVLEGGIPAWKRAGYDMVSTERIPRKAIPSIKPPVLRQWIMEKRNFFLLDIRSEKLFQQRHIEGAVNIPLYQLHQRYAEIPINCLVILMDNRGFRTVLAGSYLAWKGYDVKRLFGGMTKWEAMLSKEKKTPAKN